MTLEHYIYLSAVMFFVTYLTAGACTKAALKPPPPPNEHPLPPPDATWAEWNQWHTNNTKEHEQHFGDNQ